MKRSATLILAFFAALLTTQAQIKPDASAHLAFKGVPITGTLEEFIPKMTRAGFRHKYTEEGMAVLSGDFAAYKGCTLVVAAPRPKDLVSVVFVVFPDHDNWASLSSNYSALKEMLTEKYGEPSESVETFQSYTPKDDYSKLLKVQLDACKYYTTYKTDKGTIQISIDHEGVSKCFVRLAYLDKINGAELKKGALDDL